MNDYTPEQRRADLAAHPNKSLYYTKKGRLTWFALCCKYKETKADGAVEMVLNLVTGKIEVRCLGKVVNETTRITTARRLFDNLGKTSSQA